MYVTITGMGHYLGIEAFRLNQILTLEKDEYNQYDTEAIKVLIDGGAHVGYVANSTYTKAIGTSSAGYIQRDFDKRINAKVKFITKHEVIAELLLNE